MNVFDVKSALLAKHAQHVVLVHFPIALTITAIVFDWLAALRAGFHSKALFGAAYWNLTVAAVMSAGTVATGWLAWRWQLEGAPLTGTLLLHALFGCASAGGIVLLWWLRVRQLNRADNSPGPAYFALSVIVLVLIALTGHLGGFVSGVN